MNAYCQKCKEELDIEDTREGNPCPKCESKSFVAGDLVYQEKEEGKGYTCGCAEPKLEMTLHLNLHPNHHYEFTCKTCGKVITVYNHNDGEETHGNDK